MNSETMKPGRETERSARALVEASFHFLASAARRQEEKQLEATRRAAIADFVYGLSEEAS